MILGTSEWIESADDFVLANPTSITSATFTGLVPTGFSVTDVVVEIYRVFPLDSNTSRTLNVPTRMNSPSSSPNDRVHVLPDGRKITRDRASALVLWNIGQQILDGDDWRVRKDRNPFRFVDGTSLPDPPRPPWATPSPNAPPGSAPAPAAIPAPWSTAPAPAAIPAPWSTAP